MTSSLKRKTSLLQDDLEEVQLSDLSPIIIRVAVRCNAKCLIIFQQIQQFSSSFSISKDKDSERFSNSSITFEYHFNQLELMMKRLLEIIQIIVKVNSRYSLFLILSRFSLKIFPKMHESFEDFSISHIDSQDQLSNQIILS